MEQLGSVVRLLLCALILATPYIVAMRHYKKYEELNLLNTYLISMPICFFLIVILAAWPEFYSHLRLELMGFDFNGWSDEDRARNVAPHLKELATKLYWSNMGVGWPLSAILLMVFFVPFPAISVGIIKLVGYIKCKFSK